MAQAVKDPVKVKAGIAGSRARWGERRVVRLDQLDADTARLIRALLAQRPTQSEAASDSETLTARAGVEHARSDSAS